jgi:retron-type reverse transcriptase
VPDGATPAEAIRARWAWTAPEVWTDRMLTALEQGVRGGRWFTLIDQVYAQSTLRAAVTRVKANRGAPGVDHVTVAMFEARLDANLAALAEALRTGTYRPQPSRRHWIPKGPRERRPLGIPTVRDRVVQTALRLVLEPIFDGTCAEHRYGFRSRRGAKEALRQVVTLLRAGYRYVVDADLRAYVDTIPHAPLRARVASKVSDTRLLALVDAFLHQPIFEGLAQGTVDEGTPQGAVISPLLANLYLDPLDQAMVAAGYAMVATTRILFLSSEANTTASVNVGAMIRVGAATTAASAPSLETRQTSPSLARTMADISTASSGLPATTRRLPIVTPVRKAVWQPAVLASVFHGASFAPNPSSPRVSTPSAAATRYRSPVSE